MLPQLQTDLLVKQKMSNIPLQHRLKFKELQMGSHSLASNNFQSWFLENIVLVESWKFFWIYEKTELFHFLSKYQTSSIPQSILSFNKRYLYYKHTGMPIHFLLARTCIFVSYFSVLMSILRVHVQA